MVKIPPDTNLLHSYCHSNLPWWKGLAELIDNAIDAGAKQVKIAVKDRVLTVSDDGRGAADIMALFKLGNRNWLPFLRLVCSRQWYQAEGIRSKASQSFEGH